MQTKKQLRLLIYDFVIARCPHGEIVDAVKLSMKMNEMWGLSVDWHEFSSMLDYMHNEKLVTHYGFTKDGFVLYKVN